MPRSSHVRSTCVTVIVACRACCASPRSPKTPSPPRPPRRRSPTTSTSGRSSASTASPATAPDKQESGLALDTYAEDDGRRLQRRSRARRRSGQLAAVGAGQPRRRAQDAAASRTSWPTAKLDLISKWIEQGAPENAGSKVDDQEEPAGRRRRQRDRQARRARRRCPRACSSSRCVYTPKRRARSRPSPPAPGRRSSPSPGRSRLSLYNTDSGAAARHAAVPRRHSATSSASAATAACCWPAAAAAGTRAASVLFDVKTGKRIAKIGDELDAVLAADINATHTLVALGGPQQASCASTRPQTGELLHEIQASTPTGSTAVEFSPDGVLLATADRSGGLFVWEADTAREYLSLRGHNGGGLRRELAAPIRTSWPAPARTRRSSCGR